MFQDSKNHGVVAVASRPTEEKIVKKEVFILMHLNIQSIRNKVSMLEVTLNHVNAQALCVNEHWLTNDEASILNINNFLLAACFSRDRTYGGVAIYLRQDVEFLEIDLKKLCI